jgi:Endonuclease-reverse transcriptase
MQWNARGLRARLNELKNFLFTVKNKPDVICIEETFLKPQHSINIYGYNIVRVDRDGEHGGVATLVRQGLNYKTIASPPSVECVIVDIFIKSESIRIVNIYIPPMAEIAKEAIKPLFNRKTIITGDFNAHSSQWGHPQSNRCGKLIEEMIEETDFVVLNTGEGTYQMNNGGMSALDLSLCAPNIAPKCTWHVNNCTLGSDHLPTFTTINQISRDEEIYDEKLNINKADWNIFKIKCAAQFENIQPASDIDSYELQIRNAILSAAEASMPVMKRKNNAFKSVPYWDPECSSLIKQRNKARNKANRTKLLTDCIEYRRTKGVAQATLKSKARQHWMSYCDTLQAVLYYLTISGTISKMRGCR